MSDLDGLLAAVLAEPESDVPRLVAADWYEENGQAERAKLIRCQIALFRSGHVRGKEDIAEWNRVLDVANLVEHIPVGPPFILDSLRFKERPLSRGDVQIEYESDDGSENPSILVSRGFIHTVRGPLAVLRGGNSCGCEIDMDNPDVPCPRCHGTGRTPGILRELVRREPVEVVEAIGKIPYGDDENDHCAWFPIREYDHPDDINDADVLPNEIFDLMKGDTFSIHAAGPLGARFSSDKTICRFRNRKRGLAALSNALLAEAKGQVTA